MKNIKIIDFYIKDFNIERNENDGAVSEVHIGCIVDMEFNDRPMQFWIPKTITSEELKDIAIKELIEIHSTIKEANNE